MYINPNVTPAVARRQRIERAIVRRVVKDALAAGYVLSVDDGGGMVLLYAATAKAVLDALMNTDEDYLHLDRFVNGVRERIGAHGWVRFVYGNDGWDVICDHSENVENVLAGANALAERLEGK